jgi:predicted transcriptional regulator
MDNIDAINTLTGSEARWRILLALLEEPTDFGTLRDDLDIPQSTLNRNLTTLSEEGWVRERADRTYHLTSLGEVFVDRVRPLEDLLAVVDELSEHPDAFPLESFDFDIARLADANWETATDREPYSVINRVRAVIEEGTRLLGISPHYNPAYIDVTARVADKPGAEVVGITPAHQLEPAAADDSFEPSEFTDTADVEFRVWDGDTDYGLAIVDDETVLFTGDHAGGMPSILVETDDPEILSWAQSEFDRIYDQSTLSSEYPGR